MSSNQSETGRAARVGLVAAACWLLPIVLSCLSNQADNRGRYTGHLASLCFAPLFVLLAAAAGDWILHRMRVDVPQRWTVAGGLGLGAFSLGTLLVGLVAVPSAPAAWAALVALAVLLRQPTGRLLAGAWERVTAFREEGDWVRAVLVAIVIALVLLNVLRAFVPPTEYDEMEYHLAAPARYVRDGRISFLSNNAYASFPENVEMLFLDAMILRGGVIEGLALGRLLNVALGVLAACAVGACAGAMFHRAAAVPAAAIFYTWPWVNQLSHVGYVELGLMLYVALAVLAAWHWHRSGRRPRNLVLLGLICGLAVGCKYPAALFVCVPAVLSVLVAGGRGRWGRAALFAGVVLAACSPWLLQNLAYTGNPVYPLLGRALDGHTWSARKAARWTKAHRPDSFAPAAMWSAVRRAAAQTHPRKDGSHTMSLLLVLFVPLAFVRREWRARAGVLLLVVAFCLVGWLLFTHRIPRFLIPWLVPLAVASAAGAVAVGRRPWRGVVSAVLVALAAAEAYATVRTRSPAAECQLWLGHHDVGDAVAALKQGSTYDHGAIRFVNALPEDTRTLFYGEARTLYCTADVIAPTVFDENPLDRIVKKADSPAVIYETLQERGITHIYVNLPELHRLQWSYAFRHAGRDWPGYATLSGRAELARLYAFLRRHSRVVYPEVRRPAAQFHRAFVQAVSRADREAAPRAPSAFFVYELLP
ncbi:MAG: hypothetical protein ACOC70_00380 [bacterium]